MGDDVTLGEVFRLLQAMDARQARENEEIQAHLKALNGRTWKTETEITLLDYRVGQVEDAEKVAARDAGQAAGRTAGRNWGAGLSAIVSAIVSGLMAVFGWGKS